MEISPLEAGLFTVNNSAFLGELMLMCKVDNVFKDEAKAWADISDEQVLTKNPAHIIKMYNDDEYSWTGTIQPIADRIGWETVDAVANGKIHQADSVLYSRPTNRIVQIAQDLALKIHGVTATL